MLRRHQSDIVRGELRLAAGWLSALVGNLAFHLADHEAALIHFATAARLGTAVGHPALICWTLGAQAMTAYTRGHPREAVELAQQALEYADTPLRRAQILAWGELRATAALGPAYRAEAARLAGDAQDAMAADSDGDRPGRFGFDAAELFLHLAEASLLLGDHAEAAAHAAASQEYVENGRPGWGAAVLVHARAEASGGRPTDAAELGHHVLDTIPPERLRGTLRIRLGALDADLQTAGASSTDTSGLRDRLRALPALEATGSSPEPNGR
ncbi:hypothetical protein DP939_34765 [Spongiactinospora rosea]|uniref:Tetratricopeptide repeat protein n=2 Tax=Spongiactinospora rosea TaxID=2248750 RepID=A0A366LP56_9ACTN|nr:hypothetical protein DP939_34765 [Spongiactinospora rosea]